MTNLRSHIDPDQANAFPGPTKIESEQNRYQVRCGLCNAPFYVDEGMYRFAKEGMEAGLDNPFKCEDCEQEYDELSY